MELPRPEREVAVTTGGSLDRTAGCVSVAILGLAVAWLLALDATPASANHVSCGDEITANTTLDSDLVDCPSDGIVIDADGITLDLNGHTIDGDGELVRPCPGGTCDIGIENELHAGVTIKGGTVKEFGLGVELQAARRNLVRDLSVLGNAFEGVVLAGGANNSVRTSAISRNGREGMELFGCHNNKIARNRMAGNGDVGLIFDDSDRNVIRHNRSRRNPEHGMIIEGARNRIVRNRSVRDGGGILITGRDEMRTVGNVIRSNEVRRSRRSGISVGRVGLRRTRSSRDHVLGAGRDGIKILNPSTRLSRNLAVRNGDLSVQAVEGVIDGGGNRARGNRDPRQCVNVTCR